ncbi:MAG: hypothetical protein LC656_07310, partial [Sphingomonadales bacterium]|nr:hypothetical protein [Sphingomonadales bacterium]
TWTQVQGHGFPAAPGRIGIATSAAAPNRVYALVDAKDEKDGGLYRSDDGGATWAHTTADKRIWNRGWYFGEIAVDPDNAEIVTSLNTIVLESRDGGKSFVPTKGDETGDDFHTLWIDPKDSKRRILGVDQGALISLNGGATWSSWYNQPTGQFYHVSTDNRYPYRVYGSQQDSGAAAVSSRSFGIDGIDIGEFHEQTAGGESDNIAPDPDDPDTVFGGRVDKLDLKTGQTRSVDPTLAVPDRYRATWTLPLVFGPRDHALYFGNQKIFRTIDKGEHWSAISPDLTRPSPGAPPTLDAPTLADDQGNAGPRKGVVYVIGPSPLAATDVWAGTDDGLVWHTRDGGAHWTDVTPAGLGAWSKISAVEPSHFNRDTAYLAIDRHRLEDRAPHLLRTTDGGRSWQPIMRGLGDGSVPNSANVVREDPLRRGLLFAGTEHGLYVSFDDGDQWRPLQGGLPTTSVRDITVHGNDVVIATHGRGFYILDDIAPLREIAANAALTTRLFAPAAAILTRPQQFTGTPKPKDEPMAANPPTGAILDYYLASPSAGPVQIAIADSRGTVIRRYSSADPIKPVDLSKLETAPEWVVRNAPPSATARHHRFVWDLRLEPPAGGTGPGVWAPPGRYAVTLVAGGKIFRQPLEVRPDPRVRLTPAAYSRQFSLAKRIEADAVRAKAALEEAKKALEALNAPANAARPELAPLRQEAEQVAGVRAKKGSPEPLPVTSLSSLVDRLAKLRAAVDDADVDPSPDARTGTARVETDLAQTLAQWAALKARLVPLAVAVRG